jgi:hypothetical protein
MGLRPWIIGTARQKGGARKNQFFAIKVRVSKKGVLQTPPCRVLTSFLAPSPSWRQLMHSPRGCRPSLVCGSASERPRTRNKWSLFLQYQVIKVQLVKKWHVRSGCSAPSAKYPKYGP